MIWPLFVCTTPHNSKSGCFQVYSLVHLIRLLFGLPWTSKTTHSHNLISPDQLLSSSQNNNETRGPFCRMGVSGYSKGGAHLRSWRKSLGFESWSHLKCWIWSATLRRDLGSCVGKVSTFRLKKVFNLCFFEAMIFWSPHFSLVDVHLLQLATSWHVFSRDIRIPKAGTNEDRKIESWQGPRMQPDSPNSLKSNEASAGNRWHNCGV